MEPENYQSDAEGEWRDEEEKRAVQMMRTLVESKNPASKAMDDATLRRFLRARSLNIQKASDMFLKYLRWRQTAVPDGFVQPSEITRELAQQILFSQGYDKSGHPIVVCLARRYFPRDLAGFKRLVIYTFDKLCSRMLNGREKFVIIVDLQGWGYSNCDVRGYIAAVEILQNYYPERLYKVLLIHTPYIFKKAWKLLYPFIDDNTKEKFFFVDDKKVKETLHEAVDEDQLPDFFGGKLPLVRIENA